MISEVDHGVQPYPQSTGREDQPPRTLTYAEAVREATAQEMRRDPRVFVMGMGVDQPEGIYGTTEGLVAEFGASRVLDTPISEEGMTGVAVGAAMAGMRPIHVHIRMDFLLLAMNQLVNIAAKARYMSGGASTVPLVVRAVIGRSWGQGAQHSQGLHSLFSHIPGLRVVAPGTPFDAKGGLIASIREDNPVIFVEHRLLHRLTGAVPEQPYVAPLGAARLLRTGSDVTIVAISYQVVEALRAARALSAVDVEADVIDPVWLSPFDWSTIVGSVRRTGRLLVVDTAWTQCGVSSEIVASVTEALQGDRSIRCRRLGFAPTPCPTSKPLEELFYPNAERIALAALDLVRGESTGWRPDPELLGMPVAFRGPF